WNSSYDSRSRSGYGDSHSHGIPQPRKARFHQTTPQIGRVTLLPAFVEEPRYDNSFPDHQDELEHGVFYVSQKRNEEHHARQDAHSNYLAPPYPNPPRNQNDAHYRGRQKIRRYEVDLIRGN